MAARTASPIAGRRRMRSEVIKLAKRAEWQLGKAWAAEHEGSIGFGLLLRMCAADDAVAAAAAANAYYAGRAA